jgi:hypothetical protein
MMMDERGVLIRTRRLEGFHPQAFYRGRNVPLNPLFFSGFIQQESTFWRRSLWEKAGGFVDKSFRLAGDFELWSRFFLHASLYAVAVPLGIFRFQPGAYTANEMHNYLDVCRRVLSKSNAQPPRQMECRVRRGLRLLPHAVRRFTGLAYSAPIIDHGGRNGNWTILRDWFV